MGVFGSSGSLVPEAEISATLAETEPSKPSKPGFDGFVGSLLDESAVILDRPWASPATFGIRASCSFPNPWIHLVPAARSPAKRIGFGT